MRLGVAAGRADQVVAKQLAQERDDRPVDDRVDRGGRIGRPHFGVAALVRTVVDGARRQLRQLRADRRQPLRPDAALRPDLAHDGQRLPQGKDGDRRHRLVGRSKTHIHDP